MKSWGPNLRKLFAGAEPNEWCFCGRPIRRRSRRPQLMCGRRECLREYMIAYRLDHPRGSHLRRVLAVEPHPIRGNRRLILLECGHRLDLPKSLASVQSSRRACPACESAGVSHA